MEKSITSAEYAVFLRLLRQARQRAGLTQIDMAERIGEAQTFVSKCERGERRLDVLELRSFCTAMNLPLEQFARELEAALAEASKAKPQARSGRHSRT